MKKNLCLMMICSLFVFTCWTNTMAQNVPTVKLVGKNLKVDESNNQFYPKLIVGDLLLSMNMADAGLYASVIKNDELSKAENILKAGEEEFSFGSMSQIVKEKDKSLLVMTPMGFPPKMFKITNTSNIASTKDVNLMKKIDLSGIPSIKYLNAGIVPVSDSKVLLGGTTMDAPKHIFSFYDFNEKKVTPIEFFPNDGVNASDFVKNTIYTENSKLYTNGNGRYLYECSYERYSFIFSVENDNVNVIKGLYEVYPDYSDPDGYNPQLKTLSAKKLNCAVTDDKIYVLLKGVDKNGTEIGEIASGTNPQIFGNTVEVYDWEGNKQKVFELDHLGKRIMLSDDGKKIYLFSDDSDKDLPEILVYSVDK